MAYHDLRRRLTRDEWSTSRDLLRAASIEAPDGWLADKVEQRPLIVSRHGYRYKVAIRPSYLNDEVTYTYWAVSRKDRVALMVFCHQYDGPSLIGSIVTMTVLEAEDDPTPEWDVSSAIRPSSRFGIHATPDMIEAVKAVLNGYVVSGDHGPCFRLVREYLNRRKGRR